MKFAQVLLDAVQASALVVGGLFVYFKYFNSRTFARRAALEVEASLVPVADKQVLRIEVVLRNTGLSKIELLANHQALTLWATPTSGLSSGVNPSWHEWMVSEVFTADRYVESQESIKDVALLPVASEGGPWLAFRIRAEALAVPRWKWFGREIWVTHTIVPAQPSEAAE